ncbi:hypothetical protein EWM64_g1015 [Hericium alpestre]|uniref:P-loop containing nucleoside triphosphate hydrolase protein n=1 Tax=Hericium alpestre TaxID=135208 RepID=A0A4Z0A8B1_9AGAM|nr:hypothetical protein EWM64_g1015 [Hericium alpestre]
MDLDDIDIRDDAAAAAQGSSLPETGKALTPQEALKLFDSGWYATTAKRARWMDLIGDYAGSERFIVDGESLIQHVLNDPLLALARSEEPSFQILHALHTIELFLDNLLQRAAVFDVVFWKDLRHLTIKTGCDNAFVSASRALARSLLFNHLTRHAVQFGIAVHVFDNLDDLEWRRYQRRVRPMFVMMNDGGAFGGGNTTAFAQAVMLQRSFIFDLLSRGVAVAQLTALEFRDSKIFSFVYEQRFDPNARNKLPKSVWTANAAGLTTLEGIVPWHNHTIAAIDPDDILVSLASDLLSFRSNGDSSYIELVYFFLLHLILLQALSVADRARPLEHLHSALTSIILNSFFPIAFLATEALTCKNNIVLHVDGHIFVSMVRFFIQNPTLSPSKSAGAKIQSRLESIWSQVGSPTLNLSHFYARFPNPKQNARPGSASPAPLPLFPFHNDVFDSELASIHVAVAEDQDDLPPAQVEFSQGTAFVDNKHWHAHDRTILPKHLGGEDDKRLTAWQLKKKLKGEQVFMSGLQRLAATLTGASGARLEPMVIAPVGRQSGSSKLKARKDTKPVQQQQKPLQEQRGKRSKAVPLSKADKIRQDNMKVKLDKEDAEHLSWWQGHLAQLEKMTRGEKARHLENLCRNKRSQRDWLAIEIRLYALDLEIREWAADPAREDPAVRDRHTVSLMRTVKNLYESAGLSLAALSILDAILACLGFSDYVESMHFNLSEANGVDRPLSFEFSKLIKSKSKKPVHKFMHVTEHPITWQLRLFGEYMDRSMDSQPDPRVNFKPDAWQREVLDCLDGQKSVLVVAPTSAGKTFISFYAMEQVLRASDDGIIVYVAPTKALVNQVAAEVYARFRKEVNGSTCWAIHTRDYRVHNPQKCQILVTVPEMLAIMLLSPELARNWTGRIKRIILDEIHTIGQQEEGAVWEQIILLSPCPIIGLSATIGEPETFSTWLHGVQRAKGIPYQFIQHPHRYSHLRKFMYLPEISTIDAPDEFKGLNKSQLSGRMRFIHPVSTLAFGAVEIPPDFSMESADLLQLYEALQICSTNLGGDLIRLDPITFFSSKAMLMQKDILRYEAEMKAVLSKLLSSDMIELSPPIRQVIQKVQDPIIAKQDENILNMTPSHGQFLSGLLPLLADLNSSGDLPALLFNFDRHNCEVMVHAICDALHSGENAWREKSPEWARKIEKWNTWKSQEKQRTRLAEQAAKRQGDDDDRLATQTEQRSWESYFDPNDPSPQFSFANFAVYSKEDLADEISNLSWTSTPIWLFNALWRGVGVHHSGLNKKYRALVERLFRVGFLRVVIATGTLALGINAPTKTSIFCGDSPFLTALTYRQCAGRAGRRGYDLLGKVVFYGLPIDRVQRLILSRLPRLTGTFPLSSTLCLRLFNLLHASDHAEYAKKAITSVLQLPRISFGSEVGHEQLLHHLRFSIEYLRRAHLIDVDGGPINLSGVASHLYYTEPSNLALVVLLQNGVLHEICEQPSLIQAKSDFILLMCHLFGRRHLPDVYAHASNVRNIIRKSPSIVILPEMLPTARNVLQRHHHEILRIFTSYALTFASQYSDRYGPDDQLPLSKTLPIEPDSPSPLKNHLSSTTIRPIARSLFVANSGHDDNFGSVGELARSARRGIYLNAHAIPAVERLTGVGAPLALNAYIYDFYMHGQVQALSSANGIRRGDIWYCLKDFHMILMSLRGDLEQLLIRTSEARRMQTSETNDGSLEAGEFGTEADSGYVSFNATKEGDEIDEEDKSAGHIDSAPGWRRRS